MNAGPPLHATPTIATSQTIMLAGSPIIRQSVTLKSLATVPARSAPDLYSGYLNGADYDHAVTAPGPVDCLVAELDDSNRATVKSNAALPVLPRFNADQLNGFDDQAAALVDALKLANRQDLDKARQAFASGDFHRCLHSCIA